MPDFASLRRLAPSFALLCLLPLAPISHAQNAPAPTAPVQKLADQANASDQAGKREEALRLYNDALAQARASKDAAGEALILRRMGNNYAGTGQPQKAIEVYKQALALFHGLGDKLGEIITLLNTGNVYLDTGQPQKALNLYEQTLSLSRAFGDKKKEAEALDNIGKIYLKTDQPQKALQIFREVLEAARARGDKNREIKALNDIGNVYRYTDQPQKAVEFYERTLPLYRALGDKPGEAGMLTNIGSVYLNAGEPQRSLKFHERRVALFHALNDKNGEADSLIITGLFFYGRIGQPQKQLEVYGQALSLYRALGDGNGEITTLVYSGNVYLFAGQPQEASAFYNQALPIARSDGYKNREAEVLYNIGQVYLATGQWQKTLEISEQKLPLLRAARDKQGEAAVLFDIGSIYLGTNQRQKALQFYEQALSIVRATGDKRAEAYAICTIAGAYETTGQPQKALELLEQALPLFRANKDERGLAACLLYMGNVCLNTGQLHKALKVYEQTLSLYRALENKHGGEVSAFGSIADKQGEVNTLCNIGSVYLAEGQPQKAWGFCEQTLPLLRVLGDKNNEANTFVTIGDVCFHAGQRQRSLKFLKQAVSLARTLEDKDTKANAFSSIGGVYFKIGQPRKALDVYKQAVTTLEELRANIGSPGEARSGFLASHLSIYYRCLNLLCQSGRTEEAFMLAQKTKARSLIDLLASSRVDLNAALTLEERQQVQGLRQQAEQINAQMLKEGVENEAGAKKRFAALQARLKRSDSELQLLMDRLYARHPGLADQRQARTATLPDLAPLLPAGTALLEYVQTSDKELRLFVVTTQNGRAQVHLHTLAIHAAQLQRQCSAFHTVCADPRKDPFALSASLSRLLLTPAQADLRGRTRLIVCPDGPLWDVPFAALRAPSQSAQPPTRSAKAAPLWERYELSYAYSATGMQAALAARAHHKPAEHASVLALANPFFGSSSRFGDIDGVPGQRPFELPSRPIESPSRPFELPSRPFELPSRPFETPSRPFEVPSRPVELPSRPMELPSRQLMAAVGTDRGKAIRSLPGAQQEAEAIRRLFPDAAIYTGKAAQESVVIREAGKYKYLHFATHGFFNDAAPLLSCIVLAQPQGADKVGNTQNTGNTQYANSAAGAKENTAAVVVPVSTLIANAPPADALTTNAPTAAVGMQADDGLLTARKVFGLHLNADLVTLSACNSGRGQVRTGEGIVGLTWAFFAAGCPAQVVSQWSVDDAATGQLMTTFYAGLKQGKSKSAALRDAALKLSKDGKHRHPYYWTPFFLVGDWR